MPRGAFVYLAPMSNVIVPEEFYRIMLETQNTDSAKQGWVDETYHARIFDVLLDLAQKKKLLSGLRVHDAGCGFGSLRPRILALGASYVGTDFLGAMVAGALERQPDGIFEKRDLTKEPAPDADITIVCGTLAYQNAENTHRILENLWEHSRVGLVFVAWWDVPTALDPSRISWDAQQAVKKFLRKIGWEKVIRRENYGIPYERSFGVFR